MFGVFYCHNLFFMLLINNTIMKLDKDLKFLSEAYSKIYVDIILENEDENFAEKEKEIVEGDEVKTYDIEERYYNHLVERVGRINKRNSKYGIPPIEVVVVKKEHKKESIEGNNGWKETGKYLTWYTVKVVSKPPMIEGWEFVARIDHDSGGNIIVKSPQSNFNGSLVTMYGSRAPECDHCHTIRDRKATYIITNGRDTKAVGKSCLRDYVNGDPYKFISYAETLSSLLGVLKEYSEGTYDDERGEVGSSKVSYKIKSVIGIVYFLIKQFGYISSKKANESADPLIKTTDRFKYFMEMDWKDKIKDHETLQKYNNVLDNSGEYEKISKDILEWASAYVPVEYKNAVDRGLPIADFFGNLNTIITRCENNVEGIVDSKHVAYIAALVSMYNRARETALKPKTENVSEFQGTIGEKLKDINVKIVSVNTKDGDYGTTYIIKMVDDKGNEYVWFSSKDVGVDAGDDKKILVGTVKNHNEFRGVKSTVLTRIKFA